MRVESLTLRGFKAFDDAAIRLAPFTVLVGPNGAGKTTVLQAIDVLAGLVRGNINELLASHGWEYADLPHLRSAKSVMDFACTLVDDATGEKLVWQLKLGARRYPGIAAEVVERTAPTWEVLLERKGRSMERLNEAAGQRESIRQTLPASWLSVLDTDDKKRFPGLWAIAEWARGVRGYFFLDPLKLRERARGDGTDIGRHGEGIAPFLAHLRKRAPGSFLRLIERVQKYYPRLEAIVPRRSEYGWTRLTIRERWNGEVATFNARQVSDGLLRLIAVSAMRELPSRPSVLLLDEIENGLHPRLLGGFVQMLQDLARSGIQVIVASHSPITVNYVDDPEGVLVVKRGPQGGVQVTPLSNTKGFERLRQQFDFGELWYNVGEDRLVK